MKKVIDWIFKNMFGFILGAIIFTVVGVVAAISISSAQVTYTGNSQSTVEGALNDLYIKANTWVNPSDVYFDLATAKSNTAKNVFASNKGVCINRNNNVYCFKINNYDYEKNHIQQVFSDINCYEGSTDITCYASDLNCMVSSYGWVFCQDTPSSLEGEDLSCYVYPNGSVDCN